MRLRPLRFRGWLGAFAPGRARADGQALAMLPQYVVLGAGASRRMGFDKVVAPLGGSTLLARVAAALGDREFVAVVPSRLSGEAARIAPAARIATNDEPDRGMAHSLHVGLRFVARDRAFGVLPADMPAMTHATIAATERLLEPGVDVAYPVNAEGTPGHPVLFSPRARAIVDALPDGDTVRRARDDASLRRVTWVCADPSAFLDLDVPADWIP